ncbi:hypothetical protein [uncultured Rikenella sp.]|uniref:hypothetical protein n=1 Tax=uncultured Rikenella sp. TaxID=368003 RepID=UPI0025DBF0A1|nr:hypothetical protein [uncultured Rikenella sp.]
MHSAGTAPGFRERANGGLVGVGESGYSWSSTVSGTLGMNLGLSVAWLSPCGANGCAYGFQLRCLSE